MMLSSKYTAKTRRDHRCFGCLRVIPMGSKCLTEAWVTYGEFAHGYLCLDCEWIRNKVFKGDEWHEGEFWELLDDMGVIKPDFNAKKYIAGCIPL